MKKITIILTVLIALTISTKAQTASDYYLPLCVGNYTQLLAITTTTFYRFIRLDSINSVPYFVEQGIEITNDNPPDTSTFRILWLRNDGNGNIVVGAYATSDDENLESATILSTPMMLFPNQFLTNGYSQTFPTGENVTSTDSVISVTATAGSYANCLQIRNIRKDNGIIDRIEDTYYAYHSGIIKMDKFFPSNEAHVNNLVDFVAENCFSTAISEEFGNENEFSIYPNPASDIVTFKFDNIRNSIVTLNIYNVIGKFIRSETIRKNQQQINIDHLRNGIYIVEIKSRGLIERHKLIIQR